MTHRDLKRPPLPREKTDWIDRLAIALFLFMCLAIGLDTWLAFFL